MPDDIKLAGLAWLNECEGWLALGKVPSQDDLFTVELIEGVVCALWQGVPGEMENYLLVPTGFQGDLVPVLDVLAPSISSIQSGVVLRYLLSQEQPGWRQALEKAGFLYMDSAPLMACNLGKFTGINRANREAVVRPVETDQDHDKAVGLINLVFGGSMAVSQFFNPPAITRVYTAWLEGSLVSTATLWPFSGAAGVYSVSTLPGYRRHGFAKAVMECLMLDAKRAGFDHAVLRTVDAYIPLYQECGFRPYGRVARWIHFWH